MTFAMRDLAAGAARTAVGETPFDVQEIFFSRTDARGVISAFNSVFMRIAGYSADDLLNAPHRIIRHDDMPKAVFWLLWTAIQSGKPIGAYVKNRAKDGRFYWVFAVVTPVEGGYLSVRLKPTSAILAVVEREYAALRQIEKLEKLSPEDSAMRLLERLATLGFPTYANFQARALAEELACRDAALGLQEDRRVSGMLRLLTSVSEIQTGKAQVSQYFSRMMLMPTNMRIIAARIERSGGPISTISDNYRMMSDEVIANLEAFAKGDEGRTSILHQTAEEHGLFVLCAARVMAAARTAFAADRTRIEGVDCSAEGALLAQTEALYDRIANEAMQRSGQMALKLLRDTEVLRRSILGLDSIRIMCRVESGRLARPVAGLGSIIANLDEFHARLEELLETIAIVAQRVAGDAETVLSAW
jgi:PAS domain S-box-containing protein